jgi:transposase
MSRQQYSGGKKFQVALEAIEGKETIAALSSKYGIAPTLISKWKKELIERGSELFEKGYKAADMRLEHDRDQLLKKVGELSLEVDYLKKGFASI